MKINTNGKLLLVEDDVELRETLEEIFMIHGISHDVAKNVSDAKERVFESEHPYRLVLSDFLMPGENGLEFFNFLKQQNGYAEIPFYILSARTEDEVRDLCKDAGVTDFIKKPFQMQKLVDLVKDEIDS